MLFGEASNPSINNSNGATASYNSYFVILILVSIPVDSI